MGATRPAGIGIAQVMPYPGTTPSRSPRNTTRPCRPLPSTPTTGYYEIEGCINAKLITRSPEETSREPTREKLVEPPESTPFDLGGYKVSYSATSHNGSRFVDLTVLGQGTAGCCADACTSRVPSCYSLTAFGVPFRRSAEFETPDGLHQHLVQDRWGRSAL